MMKSMGYGADYRHAHSEVSSEGAYAAGEEYFPQEMDPQAFYHPQSAGLEEKIRARLARLRTLDHEAGVARRGSPKDDG